MDPRPALDALLFGGILLFGVGFLWRDRRCHLARAAAWAAFGVFWFLQVPAFLESADAVNALGAAAALPIFLFLAVHEKRSYDWREEYAPLRFLAGGAFFAAGIYFTVDRIPLFAGTLIQVVTAQTVGLLNAFSPGYAAGPVDVVGNTGLWRSNGSEMYASVLFGGAPVVNIILACTAIQGITITAALVPGTTDPPKRKALVLAILVPATYIMNLVRNVVVISLFRSEGYQNWDIVHNGWGKGIGFASLLALMLLAFWLLPELYLNINGLFELPWRRSPGHDYKAHVGRILGKIARPKAVEEKLRAPPRDFPPKTPEDPKL